MKVTMASSSSYSFSSSPSVVLLLALLFWATHTGVNADVDPLLPACKTVGGGSMYVGIDFCMSALGSDNRSRDGASYQDLSIIAVDLVTANATSTAAKIDNLLREGGAKDDATKQCLESCQTVYKGIVERQPGCAAAVKGGRFDEATSSLEKSASAAKECEDGFGKSNVTSPVTVEDDSTFKLAKLAVALLGFAY